MTNPTEEEDDEGIPPIPQRKGVFGDDGIQRTLKPEYEQALYEDFVKFWETQFNDPNIDIKAVKDADGNIPMLARENFNKDIADTWHKLKESISIQNNIEKYEKFREENEVKGKTGKLALIALKSVLRWATGQSSKITASQIITLLTVAQYEGQKLSFYVDKTGQLKSTVSRHMLEMGQPTKLYKGLDWIDVRPHPHDARASQYFLTPKGHQFVEHIEEQLDMPYEESSLLSAVMGIPMIGLKQKLEKAPPRGDDELRVITTEGKVKNVKATEIQNAKYDTLGEIKKGDKQQSIIDNKVDGDLRYEVLDHENLTDDDINERLEYSKNLKRNKTET